MTTTVYLVDSLVTFPMISSLITVTFFFTHTLFLFLFLILPFSFFLIPFVLLVFLISKRMGRQLQVKSSMGSHPDR